MSNKIDQYIDKQEHWRDELSLLRSIVLESELVEELKWGVPTYTLNGKNVIMLGSFKGNCVISFLKGVLLKDSGKVLELPGENSRSAKIIRITSLKQAEDLKDTILAYVFEAIEIEKLKLKVPKATQEEELPEELVLAFESDPKLEETFFNLTPGRQRGYLIHFKGAKQSKTRTSRIEASKKRIYKGVGFHDCVCGLSKRMPNCDGSHKQID